MTEHVLEELQRRELNVVASSFDGKSHQRVTTGLKGEPQTLIQLAKDHWKNMKKIKTVHEIQLKLDSEENGLRAVPRLALIALRKLTGLR